MNFEKKYWSTDEFFYKNGDPYEGYVGILDGEGYTYDKKEKLVKNDSYLTQFNSSNEFFDRILDEPIELPYKKSDIQFHANDFLYRATIKNILQKLQENNDYIFKCATLSDTLIPAVNDCSVLATVNNSHYVFVDDEGNEHKSVPDIADDSQNGVKRGIEAGYIINPNFVDTSDAEKLVYPLKNGDLPKATYAPKWYKIPNTKYILDLQEGILKRYDLASQKNTRTALDPTFYPQVMDDGTIREAKYNFHDIVGSEMIITNVGLDKNGFKRVKLLIFLLFKTKLIILRYIYYPENFEANKLYGSDIDFREGSKDILVLDRVDSNNKNSLEFLSLKDIRVRGNYLFLVDEKLNMVLRYDITYLRTQQGENAWNIKAVRLLDNLQGEGEIKDEIYFNRPRSIAADDNFIYVADSGNGCIKKYTSSFDYVSTIKNGNFTEHDIQTISINPYSFKMYDGTILNPNSLWIFSTTGTSLYLSILSGTKIVYSRRIDKLELLKDKYTWDEEFKSVKFSFTNSNYFYISTTKRVYKLHLSKPHYPFASLSYFKQRILLTTMVWSKVPYPWHILPCGEDDSGIDVTWGYHPPSSSAEVLDNKCFCLCGNDSMNYIAEDNTMEQFDGDLILQIGTLYNQSKVDTYCKRHDCTFKEIPQSELSSMINCSGVFLYVETDSWLSSMSDLNFPTYLSEEIEDINSSEYVNVLTFNKLLYKVVYNLINIKNHLMGRFWGCYNLDGIMVYDQMEYDDFFQNLRIEKNDDLFMHDNEPLSIIANRTFEKIHDLQEKILRHMEAKYRAQGAFTNNSFLII